MSTKTIVIVGLAAALFYFAVIKPQMEKAAVVPPPPPPTEATSSFGKNLITGACNTATAGNAKGTCGDVGGFVGGLIDKGISGVKSVFDKLF